MTVLHTVGIDPGLVHTGVVSVHLDTDAQKMTTTHTLITGPDASATRTWIESLGTPKIFIEKYRPRAHFGTDERMVKAESDFKRLLKGAELVYNTGVLNVVLPDMLKLFDLWDFPTRSHHQDLRAAARIAVLGMMKDPEQNTLLAEYVESRVFHA